MSWKEHVEPMVKGKGNIIPLLK